MTSLKVTSFACSSILLLAIGTVNAIEPTSSELDTNSTQDELLLFFEADELVSIATGSLQPLRSAPSVASLVTAEEIKAMGITEFSQILEMVPGVHVYPNPNARVDNQYSIRGIHTTLNAQIQILLNGNDISNPINGAGLTNFRYPVNNIARVEIIRGPGSALYGADAFSGVINIITKTADDIDGTNFGWRQGSFGDQGAWLQQSINHKGWDYSLSFENSRTDGDSGRIIDSDMQTILDGNAGDASLAPGPLSTHYDVMNTHLSAKNDHWYFGLWHWHLAEAGMGQGGAQTLDPVGADNIDYYLLDAQRGWGSIDNGWYVKSKFLYSYNKINDYFVLLPPGTTVPIGADGNLFTGNNMVTFTDGVIGNPGGIGTREHVSLEADYTAIDFHKIKLGAGVEHLKVTPKELKNFGPGVIDGSVTPIDGSLTDVSDTPYVFMPEASRTVRYIWLQDEWQMNENFTLTSGVRFDDYSDFGQTTNPRLAMVYAPLKQAFTTKLLYGRAFRAPSFNELYFQNNPAIKGNPDVKPETIDMLEWVLEYKQKPTLTHALNLYEYHAKGLISGVATNTGPLTSNANNQRGHGLELESNWKASPSLRIKGHLAWQSSKNTDTDKRVADAPQKQFYLSANWNFKPEWNVSTQAKWIGDRARAATDTRDEMNDYTLVNLALHRSNVFNHGKLSLGIHNLFDEDAREGSVHNPNLPKSAAIPGDLPLEGRSLHVELSYKF